MTAHHWPLFPVLDGTELRHVVDDDGAQKLAWPDGTLVAEDRLAEVVYVRPGSGSEPLPRAAGDDDAGAPRTVDVDGVAFSPDDVASLLRAVGAPKVVNAAAFTPAFFHRTVSAWLGDGDVPSELVVWPYGFWKAELDEIGQDLDESGPRLHASGARTFEAAIFRGDRIEPERVRYALDFDERGAVVSGRWLSDPPDLLDEGGAAFAAPTVRVDDGSVAPSVEALLRALGEDWQNG